LALKSDPTAKFSIPSVVQNLPIAKGKSIETTTTSAFSTLAASTLNFLVSAAHTGVSKEGTTTTICALPCSPPIWISDKSFATTLTTGALSPTLISVPAKLTKLPFSFVVAILFSLFLKCKFRIVIN
jgi:hypothetical protein